MCTDRSTLTEVPSQVSNHFAHLSSSSCRCVETPLSSIVSQSKHNLRNNARKRCIKRVFKGIHYRFQKDVRYRDAQLKTDRTEKKCLEMDELAQKDFTYRPSTEEFERSQKTWSISLNTSGRNAPMKLRSDFSEAVTKMHRLHRESVEERPAPIPFFQYQKGHSSSSSSSTSWRQWNEHWWSS